MVRLGSDVAELKEAVKALNADLQNFKWEVLKTGVIPVEPRGVQPKAANELAAVGAELRATVESVKRSIETLKFWALGTSAGVVLSVDVIVDIMMR
jgi:hypothetical protein